MKNGKWAEILPSEKESKIAELESKLKEMQKELNELKGE